MTETRPTLFEDYKEAIKAHEVETQTKYVYCSGTSKFTQQIVTLTAADRIHWDGKVPYFYLGSRTYVCHLGKDINAYQKRKYAQLVEKKACDGQVVKKLTIRQPSKKLDCPASFSVTRVYWMPRYKIIKLNKHFKTKVSTEIKDAIKSSKPIKGTIMFKIVFPEVSDHQNHVLGVQAGEGKKWKESREESPKRQQCDHEYEPHARQKRLRECEELLKRLGSMTPELEDGYLPEFSEQLANLVKASSSHLRPEDSPGLPTDEKCGPKSAKRQKKKTVGSDSPSASDAVSTDECVTEVNGNGIELWAPPCEVFWEDEN